MSLTCILEIYLRLKGRKWCNLNHLKFLKIKKGLNEEISESRLMDHEERKEDDIMSLEYEINHYRVRNKAGKHGTTNYELHNRYWI